MKFGTILEALKSGRKAQRPGWRDAFIFLVDGSRFTVNRPPLNTFYPEGTEVRYKPHIDIRTATGEIMPWTATQDDLLTEDWELL